MLKYLIAELASSLQRGALLSTLVSVVLPAHAAAFHPPVLGGDLPIPYFCDSNRFNGLQLGLVKASEAHDARAAIAITQVLPDVNFCVPGHTADYHVLDEAVQARDTELVKALLERGALLGSFTLDRLAYDQTTSSTDEDKDVEIAHLLLASRHRALTNLESFDLMGETETNKHHKLVAVWIEYGALPDLAFGTAVELRDFDELKSLLAAGAKVDGLPYNSEDIASLDHFTPLYNAIARQDAEMVNFLIASGADVNLTRTRVFRSGVPRRQTFLIYIISPLEYASDLLEEDRVETGSRAAAEQIVNALLGAGAIRIKKPAPSDAAPSNSILEHSVFDPPLAHKPH